MTVVMPYPKPLDKKLQPLDKTRPISGWKTPKNIQTLYNLWMQSSKSAQKKWMDPFGIHPLKLCCIQSCSDDSA